jgi:hypothetical protein
VVKVLNSLTADQLDRLIDLTDGYFHKVLAGEVSGYGQNPSEELQEVEDLLDVLRIMRDC